MTTTPDLHPTNQAETTPGPSGFDPRPLFDTAVDTAARVIGAIAPEQLDGPTPCTNLDVRALLGHLVGVPARVTVIGRGGDPMSVVTQLDGVADDAWATTWADQAAEARAAWRDDAALGRTVVLPWATDTGAAALLAYVSEITVHTWDLAQATGQHPHWDEAVAEHSYELMRSWLPGEHRAEIFEAVRKNMGNPGGDDAFAEAVPVPGDAPAIDRLVAWTGRTP